MWSSFQSIKVVLNRQKYEKKIRSVLDDPSYKRIPSDSTAFEHAKDGNNTYYQIYRFLLHTIQRSNVQNIPFVLL